MTLPANSPEKIFESLFIFKVFAFFERWNHYDNHSACVTNPRKVISHEPSFNGSNSGRRQRSRATIFVFEER